MSIMLPDSSESIVCRRRSDLGMLAAVGHAQLHDAAISWPKRTQRAVDAAVISFMEISGPTSLGRPRAFLRRSARPTAVAHGQILQLALAALVADRAVQRVVDEQELHHRLLRLDGLVALGAHDHALRHRVAQAGMGLGAFSTSTRHMRQLAAMDSFL
jgi:hypothetical protein